MAQVSSSPTGPIGRRLASLACTLFLSLQLSSGALAQDARAPTVTISGQVVDAETEAPLPAAVVHLPELSRRVLTDENGSFQLRNVPAGEHVIMIRQLGYEPLNEVWTIGAEGVTRLEVFVRLSPQPIVLEGIRVQADRLERRRRAAGVSARVIDQQRLITTSARNTREVVLQMTGFGAVACPGGSTTECLRVRGRPVAPSVWIDEVPAVGGLSQLEAYSPGELFRIEVFGGGRYIRVYTRHFIEHVASRPSYRPRPLLFF